MLTDFRDPFSSLNHPQIGPIGECSIMRNQTGGLLWSAFALFMKEKKKEKERERLNTKREPTNASNWTVAQ